MNLFCRSHIQQPWTITCEGLMLCISLSVTSQHLLHVSAMYVSHLHGVIEQSLPLASVKVVKDSVNSLTVMQ